MIKRICYIYLLLDTRTMKGYVGMSISPTARLECHWRSRSVKGNYKNHWLNTLNYIPQLIILGVCTQKNWQEKEQKWIRDLRLGGLKLVNTTAGGEGIIGHVHSEESKRKMSIAKRGKKLSEKHKRKIGEAGKGQKRCLGYKHTDEARENMSRAQMGRKHSVETRLKMGRNNVGMLGKNHSEETKLKISIVGRGKKKSLETRERISIALMGNTNWKRSRG